MGDNDQPHEKGWTIMAHFVSTDDLTWQGQGPSHSPMESTSSSPNRSHEGRSFSESDPGTSANPFSPEDWQRVLAALDHDTPSTAVNFFPGTPDNHVVYFVGGDTGPIKIGWTQNLRNRLPCIQNGSSVPLKVLATQRAPKAKERVWHKQFAKSRVLNEWFERTPELLAVIDSLNRDAENG